MTKKKEKQVSQIALLIANSVRDNDMLYQCENISIDELRSLEKRFDFIVFVKAYLHCLNGDRNYDKTLSLEDAIATIMLSALTPNGRSREGVLELLTTLKISDAAAFLDDYESLHGVYWEAEAERQ